MSEKEEYDKMENSMIVNAIEIINAQIDDMNKRIERINELLFKVMMEKKK